jgi:hypothetical protein
MLTFIGGNSRPVIGDRNDGAALAFSDFHAHSTRVTAMFNGVIDEIGQEVPVARSEHAPIPGNLEMPALIFRRGIEKLHDLARDFHEVYRMKRGRSIIRLYLRDPRERGEHAKDTVEVRQGVADEHLIVIAGALLIVGLLQPSAHTGQRCA